jgi:hypothetical protein
MLVSSFFVSSCDTKDSDFSNIDYTTYANVPAGYGIDYPVGWDCFEFGECVWICPTDEFAMLAEINTLAHDTLIDNWLTAEPLWCEDFQILTSHDDYTSFTGKYGWAPIYGRIYLLKASDKNHILTLLYSQDLFDTSASKIPDELSLIHNSFRQLQSDSVALPTYEPIPPSPLEVTIDQLYSDYKGDELAAGNKYKGQRLLFSEVVIEEVSSFLENPDPQIGEGFVFKKDPGNIDIYIKNGSVKFRPRDTWEIFSLRVGNTVDIVGKAMGLVSDILVIEDCWIEVTGGEGGVVY